MTQKGKNMTEFIIGLCLGIVMRKVYTYYKKKHSVQQSEMTADKKTNE